MMVLAAALITGIILIGIAAAVFIVPVDQYGQTIGDYSALCDSFLGELGQLFSSQARQECTLLGYAYIGIGIFGITGFILIIVGVVVPKPK